MSVKELMLSNCVAGEDSWESLGQQGKIKAVNPKGNQPWIFTERTAAESSILWPSDAKSWLIYWKRPWGWERLKTKEIEGSRGWDR